MVYKLPEYMRNNKRNVVIAIMMVMFLAAFEGTVVSTAMSTIAKDLQGYNLISWVFSAYLLTSAVSTPIYGKLSDLYGRKKMLTLGTIIFIIGSSFCGISQSMTQLIMFRAIQGIGAGSILTITYTIIGDIFDISERAKIQGWLSTVWGIASLIGPFLGGFLIDYLSWHWIFFINVPFGIASIILLHRNFEEKVVKTDAKIDYIGIVFLTTSIISVLLGVFIGIIKFRIVLFVIAIISLVLFYFTEKKSLEPIVPFDIFTRNTIIANLICFLASGALMAIEAYTPLYTQNVLGYTPTIAGVTMAPMSIAWLLSSFILSKTLSKYGEKIVVIVAIMLLTIGSVILKLVGVSTPIVLLIGAIVIMGFGFGGVFTTLTITVQSAVGYEKRGAATSVNALIRTLGQTIGVSIFGGIINSSIAKYFGGLGMNGINSENIYNSEATNDQIRNAFYSGIHSIYFMIIFIMIVCLCVSVFIKNNSVEKQ
ncbi:MDR family MFS transporter [Clostridium senegalense]|uniref:MDR family MFS transporter n=1 Tax=Clostridium TaxID=1485 RepID=UPI00028A08CB|nr:MDR family MFS transporter [Clostridium senegalense]